VLGERGQGALVWTLALVGLVIGAAMAIPSTMGEAGDLYKEYFQGQKAIEQKELEKQMREAKQPNLALDATTVSLDAEDSANCGSVTAWDEVNATAPSVDFTIKNRGGATAVDNQTCKVFIYDLSGKLVAESRYNDTLTNSGDITKDSTATFSDICVNLKYSDEPLDAGKKYKVAVEMMWYNAAGKQYVETETAYVVAT